MQRQTLTGSLEEQCEFLYDMSIEKIGQGNFTGAAHLLKEIVKHKPDYRDAAELLVQVKEQKRYQFIRLMAAIAGACAFIGIGTATQVTNDFVFIGLILIGGLIGYIVGNIITNFQQQSTV